jgi:uncharacterized protein (TIGR02246 family)
MRMQKYVAVCALALTMGAASWTASAQAAKPAKKLTVEQRLQRLEDADAIRELLVAYGKNFDKRDAQAYGDLFAEEGEWVGGAQGTQSYKGPDAIRDMVAKGYPPTVFPGSYHIMSNFNVTLTGQDTATAWSRWAFVVNGIHNEPVIFRGGRYDDEFIRENGVWKFKKRVVSSDPPPAAK